MRRGFVILFLAFTLPATAQTADKAPATPSETVVVTGQKPKPDVVIHDFIDSYAAPTTFLGKLARWKDGLCPKVLGLQPAPEAFIEKRVRDVATLIGARVDANAACPGNIEIVFTPQPQTLLNEIRKKSPSLLGYYEDSPSMADRVAVVSHPIQAWYATHTEDRAGVVHRDETPSACIARTGSRAKCPPWAVSGFHGADDLKSEFFNVLIVADTGKIGAYSIGALADYAAMLTLSQTQSFDSCKDLPSIANLMAQGCDASVQVTALTDTDLSYLRALYAIAPDEQKGGAKKDIAAQMEAPAP